MDEEPHMRLSLSVSRTSHIAEVRMIPTDRQTDSTFSSGSQALRDSAFCATYPKDRAQFEGRVNKSYS